MGRGGAVLSSGVLHAARKTEMLVFRGIGKIVLQNANLSRYGMLFLQIVPLSLLTNSMLFWRNQVAGKVKQCLVSPHSIS